MENQIVMVILASIITGAISTIGTIAALRVHITYLKEMLKKTDEKGTRAHSRLNTLENSLRKIEFYIDSQTRNKQPTE